MNSLTTKQKTDLKQYDPAKGAMEIHSLDTMERLALRVKDVEGLEKALVRKLEAQRDFAEHYKALYHHGGERDGAGRKGKK